MWTAILKPEITGKYSEKRKKTKTYWDQKNSKYQNTSYVEARFLHLACQRRWLTSLPWSVTPLIRCISNMNSHKLFRLIHT